MKSFIGTSFSYFLNFFFSSGVKLLSSSSTSSYLGDFFLVPSALLIKPFAFKCAISVNPALPDLYLFIASAVLGAFSSNCFSLGVLFSRSFINLSKSSSVSSLAAFALCICAGVGAPLSPTFLIFSPEPLLILSLFLRILSQRLSFCISLVFFFIFSIYSLYTAASAFLPMTFALCSMAIAA